MPAPFHALKEVGSMANESMVNESQVNESMVNKSWVNKSMVEVVVLPAPYPLLPAPVEWRTGTVPALIKAQCTICGKQAVIIANGELGQHQLHSRH